MTSSGTALITCSRTPVLLLNDNQESVSLGFRRWTKRRRKGRELTIKTCTLPLFIFFCAFLALSQMPVLAQESGSASEEKKQENPQPLYVFMGSLLTTFSLTDDSTIPVFGAGHFLHKDWLRGSFFLGSEAGLLLFKNAMKDKREHSNYKLYPDMDTETVYFKRYGLSPSAYKYDQLAELAEFSLFNLSMIDIFSSYRLLHSRRSGTNRVQMDKTNIPSMLLSPFKPKYLKNPWVFVPIAIAGASAFFTSDADKPLSKARSITMFDREYTPTQAALLTAGIGAYQYLLLASAEEMLCRGMIQTELTEHMSPWLSVPLSSLFFGLLHLHHNGWGGVFRGTVAGLYFGYRYQKNKYDLGEVISTHFWTDWLPSLIEFIRNPRDGRFVYSINWKF